jgi:hypothetical protein
MAPYAELDDLTARFPRELTPEEEDRAETLLGDASFWLGVWVPGLDDAITGGDTVLTEAAKLLVAAMVRRNLDAPINEGVSDETIGPFRVVYRNPDGNLFLYGRELDDLLGLLMPNRATAVAMRSPGL